MPYIHTFLIKLSLLSLISFCIKGDKRLNGKGKDWRYCLQLLLTVLYILNFITIIIPFFFL